VKVGERTARVAWTLGLAILWPITAIAAFHVALDPEPSSLPSWLPPEVGIVGIAVVLAAPGALAVAAADESPRWRRIIGAVLATTSAVAVTVYGVLTFHTVACGQRGTPAEIALSMLPVAVVAGIGAGLTAWQGGRLVATFRRVGIPLAFVLGWAMLFLALSAALYRALSVSCFGY